MNLIHDWHGLCVLRHTVPPQNYWNTKAEVFLTRLVENVLFRYLSSLFSLLHPQLLKSFVLLWMHWMITLLTSSSSLTEIFFFSLCETFAWNHIQFFSKKKTKQKTDFYQMIWDTVRFLERLNKARPCIVKEGGHFDLFFFLPLVLIIHSCFTAGQKVEREGGKIIFYLLYK